MFSRRLLIFFCFFYFIQCKQKDSGAPFIKDKLLRQLDQAIQEHPFNDSLYYLRAHYYYQQSEYDAARKDLNYAIQLDSLSPDYYHLLADAFMDDNNSYESLSTMKHAANLFPDRIPTLLKLCEFQNILKQYDHSLVTVAQILKLDPLNAQAYLMAGVNFRDQNDTVSAVKNLIKATNYDDHLTDAWIILGQLTPPNHFDSGNIYFENAMRIDSEDINTLHSYAVFLQDNRPLAALMMYKKIINLNPSYSDAYLNAGILFFKIDSFPQALAHFNILTQLEPSESKYYYYRGTVKEAMSDNAGAKMDFEQALKLNPDFTEAKRARSNLK